jgi:hypothetical protein
VPELLQRPSSGFAGAARLPRFGYNDSEQLLQLQTTDFTAADFRLIPEAGAAYLFERNQGGSNDWGEVQKLTPSDIQMDDRFAQNVAIDAGTIVIGAYLEDGGPGDPIADAGAAYVFREEFDRFVYLPVVFGQ